MNILQKQTDSDFDLKNQEFCSIIFWIIFISIFVNGISRRLKVNFYIKVQKPLFSSFFGFLLL